MEPLPEPVQPTTQTIAKVKVNLTNMQRFNDMLYTYTLPKTDNAFILLGKNDNTDPGMSIGINLLCGALIGIGGEYGIIGCIAANYFCGLIGEYSEKKPPSLVSVYSTYTTRIQATTIQADRDMAEDYTYPVENWDVVKSGTFTTPFGTKTMGCSLGQVAAMDFPPETDPRFEDMMYKAIFSFEQNLWWNLLNRFFQINGWNTGWMLPIMVQASNVPNGDTGMNNYCSNYMIELPPHWSYWDYSPSTDKKGRDTSVYIIADYSLGSEPNGRKDLTISDDAARYLFIDTIPGTIVNPNGLFNRYFVFNDFGLRKIEQVV